MALEKAGHIDRYLTNLSGRISNAADAFIAAAIMPVLPVSSESDLIALYDKEQLRIVDDLRANGAVAGEVPIGTSSTSYKCEEYALRDKYTRRDLKNTDSPFDLRVDLTEALADRLMLGRENRVATLVTTAGSYAATNKSTLSGTTQWSDYVNSVPLTNLVTAKRAVRASCLRRPNTIIIPADVAEVLAEHPDIKADAPDDSDLRTESGLPMRLKGLLVLEPAAAALSTQRGQTTQSFEDIWSDYVWVGYIHPNPGRRTVTFGFQVRSDEIETRDWFQDDTKATYIETSYVQDEKVLYYECGYLFSDVLA